MIGVGYDAFDDPDCYKDTGVLRNKASLRGTEALSAPASDSVRIRLSLWSK